MATPRARPWCCRASTCPTCAARASVAVAESRLLRLGLRLGAVRHRRQSGPKPGSVIDESPPAGSAVLPGSAVVLTLAVGHTGKLVPTVVGLTVDRAVASLRKAGLQLGAVTAHGSAGTAIAQQEPPAGTRVSRGHRRRRHALAPARHDHDTHDDGHHHDRHRDGAADDDGRARAAGRRSRADRPQARRRDQHARRRGTEAARGAARSAPTCPPGSLIGQLPAAGTKLRPGSVVTLLVSAGMPDIAFDKDGHVFIAGGRTGTPVHTTARGGKQDEQPAWNPRGHADRVPARR